MADQGVMEASLRAFVSGFNTILLIGAVLVLVGALGAAALVRLRDFYRRPAPAAATVSEAETAKA
jgi:multisubunit Na+/H+ antiporter MnhG subunit